MRIFLNGLTVIAMTAILAASLSQKIESSAQVVENGDVLPEVTEILLQSSNKSSRQAGMRQQWARLQAEQSRQEENLLNAF